MQSASAIEDPPNFKTTLFMAFQTFNCKEFIQLFGIIKYFLIIINHYYNIMVIFVIIINVLLNKDNALI
jgi:hypothetical protein